MKIVAFLLMAAISLAGGAVTILPAPSYAQVSQYSPVPPDPYELPWVGFNSPWVYYNGDWFLNGMLYYYFGPHYGWAPYYAYPPVYIVRPGTWYGPKWPAWYHQHPQYWQSFRGHYPYWRNHRQGERYSQKFYEEHHSGRDAGWQKGFKGRQMPPPQQQYQHHYQHPPQQQYRQHNQQRQYQQYQPQRQGGAKGKQKQGQQY